MSLEGEGRRAWLGLCVLAAAVLAGGTAGAGFFDMPDRPAGTNGLAITSDHLDYDYQRGIAKFEGHVVVDDGNTHMESEKLVVIFAKDNTIRSATAVGDVHLRQGDRTGAARLVIYQAKARSVELIGDAVLSRGTDTVRGQVITFWLDEDRMTSEPGQLEVLPRPKVAPAPAAGGGSP